MPIEEVNPEKHHSSKKYLIFFFVLAVVLLIVNYQFNIVGRFAGIHVKIGPAEDESSQIDAEKTSETEKEIIEEPKEEIKTQDTGPKKSSGSVSSGGSSDPQKVGSASVNAGGSTSTGSLGVE